MYLILFVLCWIYGLNVIVFFVLFNGYGIIWLLFLVNVLVLEDFVNVVWIRDFEYINNWKYWMIK